MNAVVLIQIHCILLSGRIFVDDDSLLKNSLVSFGCLYNGMYNVIKCNIVNNIPKPDRTDAPNTNLFSFNNMFISFKFNIYNG